MWQPQNVIKKKITIIIMYIQGYHFFLLIMYYEVICSELGLLDLEIIKVYLCTIMKKGVYKANLLCK